MVSDFDDRLLADHFERLSIRFLRPRQSSSRRLRAAFLFCFANYRGGDAGGPLADDHLKALRDALIRCCEDYNADEAIRATASAMTTLFIGATADRDAAHDALERLVRVMHDHLEKVARPADAPKH
jgi:hypothetical protein